MEKKNLLQLSTAGFAIILLAACNNGGGNQSSSANSTKVNSQLVQLKAQMQNQSYDYIVPFKDYNNKIILSVNGLATAKSLSFNSNFKPKDGWGNCFGIGRHNLEFITINANKGHITTIKPTNNSTLDLTQTCDIMGTDSGGATVLEGVTDPQVYSVNVIDNNDNEITLSINEPCRATSCKDPGNGYENAGYYAQWSVWGRQYNPNMIPVNNLNHIIYAFIGFNPANGDIKTLDASADSWGLSAISRDLLQYPYLKASLSFGGWTNNGVNTAPMFAELASSETSMNKFADQAIELMQKTGFSGLDIDWEWWSDYGKGVAPAKQMLTFYKIIKNKLDKVSQIDGKYYTLSIAVNGASDTIYAMQDPKNPNHVPDFWTQVNTLVDHVNIMSYDYHGAWESTPAYFQATQDFSNVDGYEIGQSRGMSIKNATDAYIKSGISPKKLVVGIPLYGRSMTVNAINHNSIGLLENVTGTGLKDYEAGILDYKCIVNPVSDPVNGCGSANPISGLAATTFYTHRSNVATFNQYGLNALQPWGYNSQLKTFLTYDDVWSATEKTKYVIKNQLGGTMFWEIDGDATNDSQSIISTVKHTYN